MKLLGSSSLLVLTKLQGTGFASLPSRYEYDESFVITKVLQLTLDRENFNMVSPKFMYFSVYKVELDVDCIWQFLAFGMLRPSIRYS